MKLRDEIKCSIKFEMETAAACKLACPFDN